MNEIEKLLAGLSRPHPSVELDEQVTKLLGRPSQSLIRRRGRGLGMFMASTIAAGVMGFVAGRQSAPPSAAVQNGMPTVSETNAVVEPATSTRVDRDGLGSPSYESRIEPIAVEIPQNEALAKFVMLPRQRESLFGNGPIVDRSSATQVQ